MEEKSDNTRSGHFWTIYYCWLVKTCRKWLGKSSREITGYPASKKYRPTYGPSAILCNYHWLAVGPSADQHILLAGYLLAAACPQPLLPDHSSGDAHVRGSTIMADLPISYIWNWKVDWLRIYSNRRSTDFTDGADMTSSCREFQRSHLLWTKDFIVSCRFGLSFSTLY